MILNINFNKYSTFYQLILTLIIFKSYSLIMGVELYLLNI